MEAESSAVFELLQTLGVAIGGLALALKAGFDLLGKKSKAPLPAPVPDEATIAKAVEDAAQSAIDAALKDSIPCYREKETCAARIATLWNEQIKPGQDSVKAAVDKIDDNVDDVYMAVSHISKSTTGSVPVTRRKR